MIHSQDMPSLEESIAQKISLMSTRVQEIQWMTQETFDRIMTHGLPESILRDERKLNEVRALVNKFIQDIDIVLKKTENLKEAIAQDKPQKL